MHATIAQITETVRQRSQSSRQAYLAQLRHQRQQPRREGASCSNAAHALAALPKPDKAIWMAKRSANVAIVTAYNDMLSAHQPYGQYPSRIMAAARRYRASAQVAGGVPAMCDGVTQGRDGMELSLFSRDCIAQSTAIALSHEVFDAVMLLGVCDKIVPGLLMGALSFGHLPMVFVPAGPMASGISNAEKNRVRQAYARGDADEDALIAAENAAYHSPGTCTFYGTANSNQMLLEAMGLQLPGSSFIAPNTPLRDALTDAATARAVALADGGDPAMAIGELVDERVIVNAIVALLATGGSSNHTIHWVAVARCAGIDLRWEDIDGLSAVVPLLARVYPNGPADVNAFEQAGGPAFIISQLLKGGYLHPEVMTVNGAGLANQAKHPQLVDGQLSFVATAASSGNRDVVREVTEPFQADGGLRLLKGSLGRAIVKVSAVDPQHWRISAPCRVFSSQQEVIKAYQAKALASDAVIVVRDQGPRANGMPELHKLIPLLANLQDSGFAVALLTDGRLSGASGKVLSALHVTPEAKSAGPIAMLQDGDMVTLDAKAGTMDHHVDEMTWQNRRPPADSAQPNSGMLKLFSVMRDRVSSADQGAISLF